MAACSILGCHAIAERRHDAIIIHSESAEYIHEMRATVSEHTILANKAKFVSLDLLYAHPLDAEMLLHAMDHGLTREEYAWFMRGDPPGYQVLGIDYYGRNEHIIKPDGTQFEAEDVMGWREIATQYWDRYRKPIMHTETNVFEADKAPVVAVEAVGQPAERAAGGRAGAGLHLVLAHRPDRLGHPAGREERHG